MDRYAQRFAALRTQIETVQYFCKGTVLKRHMKCGQPTCACHRDSAKRHGPYWEWTYKLHGKTVNVKLTPEAGPLFKAAAQRYRKLQSLLVQMERLSRKALATQAKKALKPK